MAPKPDLTPHHLAPSETDLRENAPDAALPHDAEATREKRMQEATYVFAFSHQTPNGKLFEGTFTSVILTVRQRQSVGIARARLSGGLPFESLDPDTRALNNIIATLSYALPEASRPAWAKDLSSIPDEDILIKIYEEVVAHEATFRGPRQPT